MSVNLNKNKAAILDAYKKVTENQDGYDFAIFGYEGKTNDLRLVSDFFQLKKIVQKLQKNNIFNKNLNFPGNHWQWWLRNNSRGNK